MEEAIQRNSFPPPSPRTEIITIFITGRVSSLRFIKCSRPPSSASPDKLFPRQTVWEDAQHRSQKHHVLGRVFFRVALPGATNSAWVSLQAQFEYRVDWHDFCLVSVVIHRQGQKPRAPARPFCSHMYSIVIACRVQYRASQTTAATDMRSGLFRAGLAA